MGIFPNGAARALRKAYKKPAGVLYFLTGCCGFTAKSTKKLPKCELFLKKWIYKGRFRC